MDNLPQSHALEATTHQATTVPHAKLVPLGIIKGQTGSRRVQYVPTAFVDDTSSRAPHPLRVHLVLIAQKDTTRIPTATNRPAYHARAATIKTRQVRLCVKGAAQAIMSLSAFQTT